MKSIYSKNIRVILRADIRLFELYESVPERYSALREPKNYSSDGTRQRASYGHSALRSAMSDIAESSLESVPMPLRITTQSRHFGSSVHG
jgi:hypothetical protein